MKELSIKEKAERYDEAIEKAKEMIKSMTNIGGVAKVDDIQYLFPELQESEDKKIKEWLIRLINTAGYRELDTDKMPCSRTNVIAWLEKQCEQKSVDEVESKFKQGEWIVWKDKNYKVNYNGCGYELFDQNDLSTSWGYKTIEDNAHLWTIQDAKDGDILMANAPFIFNGNLEGGMACPGAHCGINTLGEFQIPEYPKHWTSHTTTPATKEQRSILFSKMKETGYEWDGEKKELRKISQEYPLTPDECIKPAWSEEDEERLQSCLSILQAKGLLGVTETVNTKWLKSLKNKVQPQPNQEWNEEDEKILGILIESIEDYSEPDAEWWKGLKVKECTKWLKSIKDKYTWKPSDEQLEAFEHFVRCIGESGYDNKTKLLYSLLSDLKKLKGE